jgi:hypothetical protein
MLIIACLVWVGVAFGAPAWFYICLGLSAMWQLVKFFAVLFKD